MPERLEPNKNVKEPSSDNEDKMEDSPVMGLLTVNEIIRSDAKTMKGDGDKADIAESAIVKAITKRASYFRANAEYVILFLMMHECAVTKYDILILSFDDLFMFLYNLNKL